MIRILAVDCKSQCGINLEQSFLNDSEFDLKAASNRNEVLSEITQFHPDVVLVDVSKPNEDGLKLIKELLEKDSALQIVIISQNSPTKEDILEGFRAGVADIFDSHSAECNVVLERCKELGIIRSKIKQSEKSFKEIREKLNRFIESSTEGFVFYDSDFNVEIMNDAALKILNFKREEVVGRNIFEISPSLKGSNRFELYKKVIKTGKPCIFEDVLSFPRQDSIYLRICAFKVGEAIGFSFSDITVRKSAEEALIESEKKFKALSDSSNEAIFFSEKGICIETNQAAVEMFGYTYDELIGIFGTDVIAPESKELVKHNMISGNEKPYEAVGLRKDGTKFPIELTGNMFEYDGRNVRVTTATDRSERKIVEVKLLKEKNKAQKYLDTAGVMFVVLDSSGKITLVNKKGCEILDGKEEEILGLDWFENFISPVIVDQVKEVFVKLMAGDIEPVEYYENSIIDKSGKEKTIAFHNTILRDERDNISGILFSGEDITERKKAERDLQVSEEKYKSLMTQLPIGIYRTSRSGKILHANPALAKMLEYGSVEELKEVNAKNIHLNNDTRSEQEKKWLESGEVLSEEIRLRTKNGKEIWVRDTVDAILDENGEIEYFAGTIKDITARKKTEEELKESEERFKSLAANLPGTVYRCLLDKQWTMLFINDEIENLSGYPASDFLGNDPVRTFADIMHPDDLEPIWENTNEAICEKRPYINEYRTFDSNGNLHYVWARGQASFDDDGKPLYLDGVIFDVTDQKLMEGQLQTRQRMDSLGTLAGGIAHDFNNILVGIMGNIDILKMNIANLTPDQKDRLEDASKSSDRAAELIRQFQTLSRASVAGQSTVDIFDIAKEVFGLLSQTTNRLIDKQIKIEKGDYFVHVNPGEMHQVLLNLATNSAQAIEERGAREEDYIRIDAEYYRVESADSTGLSIGDYIHITFEDSGKGMSEETLARAFDPMFTTKDKGGKRGQGLGLAMVYNIVTRIYNGYINIISDEGFGTIFHLYLPKAEETLQIEELQNNEVKSGSETILIVDDEEVVCNLVFDLLSQIGYSVIIANDGKEAMDIYGKQKEFIDAVILDLNMPIMSGEQVFEELLKLNSKVKVIISSGHSDEFSREGILSQAHGNVSKPFKVEGLVSVLRSVLDS